MATIIPSKIRLLALFIIFYSHICLAIKTSETAPHLISLHFYQTDVTIILQALADENKMNLVILDDINIKQTIKLTDVDWHKALTVVLQAAKLTSKIDGNILFIAKHGTDFSERNSFSNNDFSNNKEDLKRVSQNRYHSFHIKHASISALHDLILQQGLVSEKENLIVDQRTNMLLVSNIRNNDISNNLAKIKQLISELDKPMPQIHIAAHIVTMNNESLSELGIKWGYLSESQQVLDKFDIGLGFANAPISVGLNLAKRSGNMLNLELSALESENQLEIIASPNLLTANRHTASIKQGTDIPYEVSSGNHGATSIEFKQAVLGLEVTPTIMSDSTIMLELFITQNTAGRSIKRSEGGEVLAIDTQEIRTKVLVNHGETIMLGGIFQQATGKANNHVPMLNKIPLVGNLFKSQQKKHQRRELVIFITPQLVE